MLLLDTATRMFARQRRQRVTDVMAVSAAAIGLLVGAAMTLF